MEIDIPDAMTKSRTKERGLRMVELEENSYDYEQLVRIIGNRKVSVCMTDKTRLDDGKYIIRGVKTIGSVPRDYRVENLTEKQVSDIERLLRARK